MTSQIRSRIEYLISTTYSFVLLLLSKLIEKSSLFMVGFTFDLTAISMWFTFY